MDEESSAFPIVKHGKISFVDLAGMFLLAYLWFMFILKLWILKSFLFFSVFSEWNNSFKIINSCTTLRGLIFAWINFREWSGLKNSAWIYFREDKNFEKYLSLKKRKTTLLSIKSFYKSSKNYKYVNNFYMFDGVWSMKASKALCSSSGIYSSSLSDFRKRIDGINILEGFKTLSANWTHLYNVGSECAVWRKANSHYFFHCLKYAKKERKRVKIWKIRRHVLFESPHTNFRWWIFKIYFTCINFREWPKNLRNCEILSTRKLIHIR